MRAASMVWQSLSEVAAAVFIGWILDEIFETGRLFLIIGAVVGITVGLTTLIRVGLQESRRQNQLASRRRHLRSSPPPEEPPA